MLVAKLVGDLVDPRESSKPNLLGMNIDVCIGGQGFDQALPRRNPSTNKCERSGSKMSRMLGDICRGWLLLVLLLPERLMQHRPSSMCRASTSAVTMQAPHLNK